MNFIVEGPDCSGKTTLCKTLSKLYHLPIKHLTYFDNKKVMDSQFQDARYWLLKSEYDVILDRFIFSNIVYGNVYHHGEYVKRHQKYLTDEVLNYKKCTIIFTLPKDKQRYLEYFKSKYAERDEMYDLEKAGDVYDEYEKVYKECVKRTNLRIVRYDMFDIMDDDTQAYYEINPKTGIWELK